MKKFISIILCISIALSVTTPAFAVEKESDYTMSFATSDSGWMEISFEPKNTTGITPERNAAEDAYYGYIFEIKQFENGSLIQNVSGESGGSQLVVTYYQDETAIRQETIKVSDRVVKKEAVRIVPLARASVGTSVGYITYNPSIYSGVIEKLRVYSLLDYTDNEAYTVQMELYSGWQSGLSIGYRIPHSQKIFTHGYVLKQ